MSNTTVRMHTTRLDRPSDWALDAGQKAALRAGLIAGFLLSLFPIFDRGLRGPVWLLGGLIAALSAGLLTYLIDLTLLRSEQAKDHIRLFGNIAGAACAILPHPLFWLIFGAVNGPAVSISGVFSATLVSLMVVGLFTIPASMITTTKLLRRYHAPPDDV